MNNFSIVRSIAARVKAGERDFGRVAVKEDSDYILLNYTAEAQYGGNFTEIEKACRGLVIRTDGKIMALSMPKFFNLGEPQCPPLPKEEYTTWEKIDGCLLGNTKLNLWDGGTIKIRDVVKKRLDVMLMGTNEQGQIVPTRVVDWYDNGTKDNWILITVDCNVSRNSGMGAYSNNLPITINHQLWVNGYLCPAYIVNRGDILTAFEYIPSAPVVKFMEAGLLGDGSLVPMHQTFRYQESHIASHKSYVEEIMRWLGECSIKPRQAISGYGSEMVVVTSRTYKSLGTLRSKWYINGKKRVPQDLSWIDDFVVAKWYMDDGTLSHHPAQRDRAIFATNAFSVEDVKRLAARLEQMYDIDCTVFQSKGPNIRINAGYNGEINTFWTAIAPYIVDCMRYKLPPAYRTIPYKLYPTGREQALALPAKVLNIQPLIGPVINNNDHTYFASGKKGYDVQTTTGNYFARGILIHNSLGIFWYDGKWHCNTRGSFDNPYIDFAKHHWNHYYGSEGFPHHWTVMCEICIDDDEMARAAYKPEGLYLIAIQDNYSGVDISITDIPTNIPKAVQCGADIAQLLENAKTQTGAEGWVIRFDSGFRVKIKTAWYLRLFRAIQQLTPKHIRELMLNAGNDWIDEFPDDLRPQAIEIKEQIEAQFKGELQRVYTAFSKVAGIEPRKEFALVVMKDYLDISKWLFKLKDDRFNEIELLQKMEL